MATGCTQILILGNGPIARALGVILRAKIIQRSYDDTGWMWPPPKTKSKRVSRLPSLRFVIVAEESRGISGLIRWHSEARECPLARKVGCVVFGLSQTLAIELSKRDVFGRSGQFDDSFESWGKDLVVVDATRTLADLLLALNSLQTLFHSSWQTALSSASCIVPLIDAIRNQDRLAVLKILPSKDSLDWEALCYPHPDFSGNTHKWATKIREWHEAVSFSVTPSWEEGVRLFTPLLIKPH